jgi:hypothetical protein
MRKYLDPRQTIGIVLAGLASFLLIAVFVYAATTIGTNINTGGTLTVTGVSALNGDLRVNGFATTTASNGNFATEGTLVIGGGTAIAKHISASASLDFPIIGANDCETLTLTVTGAADGDVVTLGVPNALASASSTLTFFGWVSADDTVSVRVCQVAASATSDPAAATIRADVWQH